MAEILQAGQTPIRGVTYDTRASLAALGPGKSLNFMTGQVGRVNQAGTGYEPDPTYANNQAAAANAGIAHPSTGYLYGVGGQTLGQQGHPGVTQGVGPSTPATTWDQWATNMKNQYGVAPAGTAANGGVADKSAGGGLGSGLQNNYNPQFTGYGNSHIGGPQNNTATQTVPTAPTPIGPSRVTQPGIAIPNGGMNGVQQLINGSGQTAVAPTPRVPVPPPSTNTMVTIPTQSAPIPFIIPPPPLPGAITPIAKPRSNNL